MALAIIIAIVLALTALGKIFYPLDSLKILDRIVAVFEIFLLFLIFFLRNKWGVWLAAAIIFSAWMGFSLFWESLKLPCSCMGSMIRVPTFFSILLDLLFFFSSLMIAYLLNANRQWIYLSVLGSFLACLVGYAFAEWIYQIAI